MMNNPQNGPANELPTFSLILETENLSVADLDGLTLCLQSLAAQDYPVEQAREVLVGDSGDVPQEMLNELREGYPWITFFKIDPEAGYYRAKMDGLARATGDVIVFCDSDCIYERDWLSSLLSPFARDPRVEVVAGETTTPADGLYGVALAVTYLFPRFTRRKELYPSSGYHCNNVAFRRELLEREPIPAKLPLFRGNCVVHARRLRRQGTTIWKQPAARATHALPEGITHFFWRYLLLGHDALAIANLSSSGVEGKRGKARHLLAALMVVLGKIKEAAQKSWAVLREEPRRAVQFVIALPITLGALLLFLVGLVIALVRPSYLLARQHRMESA
jgi:GT2 family glycosyltransferase